MLGRIGEGSGEALIPERGMRGVVTVFYLGYIGMEDEGGEGRKCADSFYLE